MKIYRITFSMLLTLFAVSANAGKVQPAEIIIDTTNRTAGGDMVTARFSSNDTEFIGCGSRTYDLPDGTFYFGFCQAEDADGTTAFCNTDSPVLIQAIGQLSDFAYVTFSWNEDGTCNRVGSSTQSFYLPKFTRRPR